MRLLSLMLCAAAVLPQAFAQNYTVKTVAGGKLPEGIPGAIRIFANLISLGRAQASQPTESAPQRRANPKDAKNAKN